MVLSARASTKLVLLLQCDWLMKEIRGATANVAKLPDDHGHPVPLGNSYVAKRTSPGTHEKIEQTVWKQIVTPVLRSEKTSGKSEKPQVVGIWIQVRMIKGTPW